MFSLWVDEYKDKIDWNNIRFFWVDERCVPPTSPDSNYGHANHLLFKPLCIPADHIHQIKGENEPGTEAMRYSWVVKEFLPLFNQMPTFDCIILGIGEDSHTASISLPPWSYCRIAVTMRYPSNLLPVNTGSP